MTDQPFSKRYGYRKQPAEISIREDAPESLRHFVLHTAVELECGPHCLRDIVCGVLRVRPEPSNWSAYPNVWQEVESLVYGCEWFQVYDIIERIHASFQKDPLDRGQKATQFATAINDVFIDDGVGWQLVDGLVVTRGSEVFEESVKRAVAALDARGRATARDEIHEALKDLSRRPEADLTGAIQHSLAALECVYRDVAGNAKPTLGDLLKRYPNLIPPPLDAAVEKAWGYASEMGRHIREGREPERNEVELIVGIAATVATYLTQKQ
jgi:hypothetical protein